MRAINVSKAFMIGCMVRLVDAHLDFVEKDSHGEVRAMLGHESKNLLMLICRDGDIVERDKLAYLISPLINGYKVDRVGADLLQQLLIGHG